MHAGLRILPALVLVLLSAAVPAAQATWSAPQTLVADGRAANVAAAGNRHGSQAFVWKVTSERLRQMDGRTGFASFVRARVRLPDGRLGGIETISSTNELVANPKVGVDELGNVTAVWAQAGRHLTIMAALRPHGRRFGRPFEIGRSQHFSDSHPALAVGRFGDAVVAWNHGSTMQVAQRGTSICRAGRARGCFRTPVRLRAGADQTVAIGPLGSAYVVWAAGVRIGDDFHTRLRMASFRRDGRRLGRDHAISSAADGDASEPALAVRRDGSAVIGWRASLPAGGEQNNSAAILAVGSAPEALLGPVMVVSPGLGDDPAIVVDPQGEAILAWREFDTTPGNPDGPQIAVATQPVAASPFSAPVRITPPGASCGSPSLAVDAAGVAYLAYSAVAGNAGNPEGVSHVRPPAGSFGPPVALPANFTGVFVFSAGRKISAVSGGSGGRTLVNDWRP
ncbi:MAG TPA: hypothetical protein VMY78_18280 [Solirubrobacteraceae bacterium]|nr:hypothetical protein [Solirubrobacteraceae bacterium]